MKRWGSVTAAAMIVPSLVACDERGLVVVVGEAGLAEVGETDRDVEPTGATDACDQRVVGTSPVAGTTGVGIGVPIEVRWELPEPDADLRLRAEGRDVPGRVEVQDGARWHRFVPLAPLAAQTGHELLASGACSQVVVDWRTRQAAFRLVPASGRRVAPTSDLAIETALAPWLLGLDALGAGRVELVGAPTQGFGQQVCLPTTPVTGSVDGGGSMRATAPGVVWSLVGGGVTTARDVEVQGQLEDGATAMDRVSLQLEVDARDLARPLLGPGGSAEGVCDRVDAGCRRCADGTIACLLVVLEGVEVTPTGAEVVARSEADITGDPDCRDAP